MTSTKINSQYSWWNDVHYVPNGFFIARTGITRHLDHYQITAGYGFGKLPLSSSDTRLCRTEHRPWAQIQRSFPFKHQWSLITRLRYDARFRQTLVNGEPTNSYDFTNRIRLMATARKFITPTSTVVGKPFVGVSEELLLNFGSSVTFNTFDQNRISLMLGTQFQHVQLQIGYMRRFVKTGPEQFVRNHTLVIWFTHQINQESANKRRETHQDGE